MKRPSIAALLSIFALALPLQVAGQSLAEVARQEAARRKAAATGKVFTNADLKPAPPPSPGTTTAPAAGTTLPPPPPLPKDATPAGQATGDAKPAPPPQENTEAYWRGRVAATRDNLARAQTFQLALQARVAALNTDFVNRDDPAQRNVVANDRQKAMAELDRVQKEIVKYQAELTTIAEEARRAGAPAAWVR